MPRRKRRRPQRKQGTRPPATATAGSPAERRATSLDSWKEADAFVSRCFTLRVERSLSAELSFVNDTHRKIFGGSPNADCPPSIVQARCYYALARAGLERNGEWEDAPAAVRRRAKAAAHDDYRGWEPNERFILHLMDAACTEALDRYVGYRVGHYTPGEDEGAETMAAKKKVIKAKTTRGGKGTSSGVGVTETWARVLTANAAAPKAGRLTDEAIIEQMGKEFPGRSSFTASRVRHMRSQYSGGSLPGQSGLPKDRLVAFGPDGEPVKRAANGKATSKKVTKKAASKKKVVKKKVVRKKA